MANRDEAPADLTNNDIVFECEHCGKSLAIDVHGAGLKMQCPECNGDIHVPIPEGIELSDIDYHLGSTPVRDAREELDATAEMPDYADAAERINTLMTELEELRFRTQFLEKKRGQYKEGLQGLSQQLEAMRNALSEIDDILTGLVDRSADDTQELE